MWITWRALPQQSLIDWSRMNQTRGSKLNRITMPRKRLTSGMGGESFEVGKEVFRLLTTDLQPESIGAQVQFSGPRERSVVGHAGLAEESIVTPSGEDSLADQVSEIGFPFHAVVEAKPDPLVFKDPQNKDFFHSQRMVSRDRP